MDDESDFSDDESDGVPEQEPIEDDGEEKKNDDGEVEDMLVMITIMPKLSQWLMMLMMQRSTIQCPQNYSKNKNSKILTKFWMRIIRLIYRPKENVHSSIQTPKII